MDKQKVLVGSYVNISGVRTKIDEQLLEEINSLTISKIEPIKLDDGWLNDFGFSRVDTCWRYDHSDTKSVEVILSKEGVIRIQFDLDENYTYFNEDCQFVHLLQYVCFHRLQKMFTLQDN